MYIYALGVSDVCGLWYMFVVTRQMTWGNTAGAIESSFTSWGGGCTTVGLTRSCGFGCAAESCTLIR